MCISGALHTVTRFVGATGFTLDGRQILNDMIEETLERLSTNSEIDETNTSTENADDMTDSESATNQTKR